MARSQWDRMVRPKASFIKQIPLRTTQRDNYGSVNKLLLIRNNLTLELNYPRTGVQRR